MCWAQPAGAGEPGQASPLPVRPGLAMAEEGNPFFTTASQVSSCSAAGGGAGTEEPTFRVRPMALPVNLGTHAGGRAQGGSEKETRPIPFLAWSTSSRWSCGSRARQGQLHMQEQEGALCTNPFYSQEIRRRGWLTENTAGGMGALLPWALACLVSMWVLAGAPWLRSWMVGDIQEELEG